MSTVESPVQPAIEPSERELVARAQTGDTAALGEIVRRLEPRVAATVIGMLGRGPEAEDVGQETFIRLYRALPEFRGESSLVSYVTRIAINLCQDERRRRKRRSGVFTATARQVVEAVADPGTTRDAWAERDLVRRGLQGLSSEYREVIVLRLIDGCSTRETARILKVPEGTVTSRLARGQMRLREILKAYREHKP
jgi:RNA polymerase sigma-70 factor, ECF subfamily